MRWASKGAAAARSPGGGIRLATAAQPAARGARHQAPVAPILYRYVPRALVERPKQGFSIPLSRWLRGELAPLLDTYLAPSVSVPRDTRSCVVERTLGNFRRAASAATPRRRKVWLLLAFEMWREKWA